MFLNFFFKLKDARIPVTLNEFFTFLDSIKLDFIQFNIENLGDKLYFPHSHSTHQASVGEPLNFRLSLRRNF